MHVQESIHIKNFTSQTQLGKKPEDYQNPEYPLVGFPATPTQQYP